MKQVAMHTALNSEQCHRSYLSTDRKDSASGLYLGQTVKFLGAFKVETNLAWHLQDV